MRVGGRWELAVRHSSNEPAELLQWLCHDYCTIKHVLNIIIVIIAPPPVTGRGIVFGRFLSLFLCQQHYEKTAGPICMKFSGKVWSDDGTT